MKTTVVAALAFAATLVSVDARAQSWQWPQTNFLAARGVPLSFKPPRSFDVTIEMTGENGSLIGLPPTLRADAKSECIAAGPEYVCTLRVTRIILGKSETVREGALAEVELVLDGAGAVLAAELAAPARQEGPNAQSFAVSAVTALLTKGWGEFAAVRAEQGKPIVTLNDAIFGVVHMLTRGRALTVDTVPESGKVLGGAHWKRRDGVIAMLDTRLKASEADTVVDIGIRGGTFIDVETGLPLYREFNLAGTAADATAKVQIDYKITVAISLPGLPVM